MANESNALPKDEWAQATVQAGEIIKINGIPFELVDPVAVKGHPANFPLAGLEIDGDENG